MNSDGPRLMKYTMSSSHSMKHWNDKGILFSQFYTSERLDNDNTKYFINLSRFSKTIGNLQCKNAANVYFLLALKKKKVM